MPVLRKHTLAYHGINSLISQLPKTVHSGFKYFAKFRSDPKKKIVGNELFLK